MRKDITTGRQDDTRLGFCGLRLSRPRLPSCSAAASSLLRYHGGRIPSGQGCSMFDALLRRKFTTRCKRTTKGILETVKPARSQKQAVVYFLRQDIAHLLRAGYNSTAFGKMHGVLVNMDHLDCYDMILKFCENVLMRVPSLQKHRECPEEDREAVSTLTFAAASFSDLPELGVLRDVFRTHYGSTMEAYVNSEFKEKSAMFKAFSASRKLQLMKEIAKEFSVNWDSESFEYMVTRNVHPKEGASLRDNKSVYARNRHGMLKDLLMEAEGIHVINHESELLGKTKPFANEPEDVTPSPIGSSFPSGVQPEEIKDDHSTEDCQMEHDVHEVITRAHGVFGSIDPEGKMVERPKTKDGSGARSEVPLNWKVNADVVGDEGDDGIAQKGSSRARVGLIPTGQEGNSTKQSKLIVDEHKVTCVVSPFVQVESNGIHRKESDDTVYKRSSRGIVENSVEWMQAFGQQQFDYNEKQAEGPRQPKQEDDNVVVHETSTKRSGQDSDFAAREERMAELQKTKTEGALHLIPRPLAKPPSQTTHKDVLDTSDKSRNGGYSKHRPREELVVADDKPKPKSVRRKHHKSRVAQETDGDLHRNEGSTIMEFGHDSYLSPRDESMVVELQKTKNERAFQLIPPTHGKLGADNVGSNTERTEPPSRTTHEGVLDFSDISNNDGYDKHLLREKSAAKDYKPKPRSVRRKHTKPRVAQDIDGNLHEDEPLIPSPHGQRRSWPIASAPQDGYGDEEKVVMDRLLMHDNTIGMLEQHPTKHRVKKQAADDNGAANYQIKDECREHQAHEGHRTPKAEALQSPPAEAHGGYRVPKEKPSQPPPAEAGHVVQGGEAVARQSHGRNQAHRPEQREAPSSLARARTSLPPDPVTPKKALTGPPRLRTWTRPYSMRLSDRRALPKQADGEVLELVAPQPSGQLVWILTFGDDEF